jgi:ribosomal protein RSM22 (predicted rRNA methylase)
VLVFIEGGGPAGSHTTRTARQFLISTGASSYQSQNSRDKRKSKHAEEAPDTVPAVIAPCTHSKECPLTGGVWCSFSQAVEGGMLNKTNEEKYSYVAIQKKHASSDNGGDEEDYDEGAMHHDHDHDHDHEDGDFTLSIPLQHRDWGRIVRSPIKKRGHVVMDVCYPSGTLGRSVVSRGNGEGRIPVFYRAARKAQWGGLYPASNFATIETEADIPFS